MRLLFAVACRRDEPIDGDPTRPETSDTAALAESGRPTADTAAQPDPCATPTVVRERPAGSSFLACGNDHDCPLWETCLPVDPTDDLYGRPAHCLVPCPDGCDEDEVCQTVYNPVDTGWAF